MVLHGDSPALLEFRVGRLILLAEAVVAQRDEMERGSGSQRATYYLLPCTNHDTILCPISDFTLFCFGQVYLFLFKERTIVRLTRPPFRVIISPSRHIVWNRNYNAVPRAPQLLD